MKSTKSGYRRTFRDSWESVLGSSMLASRLRSGGGETATAVSKREHMQLWLAAFGVTPNVVNRRNFVRACFFPEEREETLLRGAYPHREGWGAFARLRQRVVPTPLRMLSGRGSCVERLPLELRVVLPFVVKETPVFDVVARKCDLELLY